MSELVELPYEKCEELLHAAIIGRVGFTTAEGPQIIPVNYTTVHDAVLFRTTPYSQLGAHAPGSPLAFEIDQIDYEDHRGWSVVAHGVGERLEDVTGLDEDNPFWNPKPWAGGARALYIRLRWTSLTGRRIGGGWTREHEMPVRRH